MITLYHTENMTASQINNVSLEDFSKMQYLDRYNLKQKNPNKYNALTKEETRKTQDAIKERTKGYE